MLMCPAAAPPRLGTLVPSRWPAGRLVRRPGLQPRTRSCDRRRRAPRVTDARVPLDRATGARLQSAIASASSAIRQCVPDTTGSPSTPICVDTTAGPIAIDSNTLSRVPPPIRNGTTDTAAPDRCGRTSSTKPVKVHAEVALSRGVDEIRRRRAPNDGHASVRHLSNDARPHLVHHELHAIAICQPIHRAAERNIAVACRRRVGEEIEVHASGNHLGGRTAVVGYELVGIALRDCHDDSKRRSDADSKATILRC